jgi:hypothetical protein
MQKVSVQEGQEKVLELVNKYLHHSMLIDHIDEYIALHVGQSFRFLGDAME